MKTITIELDKLRLSCLEELLSKAIIEARTAENKIDDFVYENYQYLYEKISEACEILSYIESCKY